MASTSDSEALPFAAELQRKALHLLALVVPLFMHLAGKTTAALVLVPAAALALGADVVRVRHAGFSHFIEHVFGFMMRDAERPRVGDPVSVNGASWVLASAALLTVVFPVHLAAPAFAAFMLADAVAAVVGRRLGRLHWGNTPRTVEGSVGFLAAGVVVLALLIDLPLWALATSAAVGAAAEAAPRPLNDNLRVPFAMAAALFLLGRYALGHPVALFWFE
jgi:dolichol kinase